MQNVQKEKEFKKVEQWTTMNKNELMKKTKKEKKQSRVSQRNAIKERKRWHVCRKSHASFHRYILTFNLLNVDYQF